MKYILTFESRVNELTRVKNQFLELLNGKFKTHWLKRDSLTYALYQTFCDKYGYKFTGDPNAKRYFDDKGNIINNPHLKGVKIHRVEDYEFHDKYPKLFTPTTLNNWFKQWREFELTDENKRKKYLNMKFPYESKLYTFLKYEKNKIL